MIAETKRQVSQLLEINRALVQDLDISHRNAATLARERDVLQELIERLRQELQVVLRDSQASNTRATQAEKQLRLLLGRLEEIEQERDDLKARFVESVSAMQEIRSRLVSLPREMALASHEQ